MQIKRVKSDDAKFAAYQVTDENGDHRGNIYRYLEDGIEFFVDAEDVDPVQIANNALAHAEGIAIRRHFAVALSEAVRQAKKIWPGGSYAMPLMMSLEDVGLDEHDVRQAISSAHDMIEQGVDEDEDA